MKVLLSITAILEAATGLALPGAPSAVASLLLGAPLDAPASLSVARIAGTALFSLGIACWRARNDSWSRAGGAIVLCLLVYNIGVVSALTYGATVEGLRGLGLWPAVALHTALAL